VAILLQRNTNLRTTVGQIVAALWNIREISVKKFALAVTLLASGVVNAMAADLPLKAVAPVTAPLSWTGIYLGIQGGGAYSDVNFYVPSSPTNVAGNCIVFAICPLNFGSHTATGGLVGGQAGINYQIGSWLVGAEVEAAWVDLKGGATSVIPPFAGAGLTGNSKTDGLFDASFRAGVVSGRALFFAKGGVAWTRATYWTATPLQTTTNVSDTRFGWIAGVGAEYAFHGPWTAKLEYDYMDFGTRRETATGVGGPVDLDVKQTIQVVKAGVNYRFSGW
jgi:outer membrane immunogenic protein